MAKGGETTQGRRGSETGTETGSDTESESKAGRLLRSHSELVLAPIPVIDVAMLALLWFARCRTHTKSVAHFTQPT